MARSVGSVSGRFMAELDGVEELKRAARRMSDQMVVDILDRGIDKAVPLVEQKFRVTAPRQDGRGARGYHGADRIVARPVWSRRDRRAVDVGPEAKTARHLQFHEKKHAPAHMRRRRPFMTTVTRWSRPRVRRIMVNSLRRATRVFSRGQVKL